MLQLVSLLHSCGIAVIDSIGAQNDMLMWLMSEAKGVERSPEGLARRLLLVNFAAINATSLVRGVIPFRPPSGSHSHCLYMVQMVTQVLCRLLSNPEYFEPLRQEVEAAVAEEGWTKAGMDKMRKIDSFLRETQRVDVESIGLLASSRCFAAADIGSSSDANMSHVTPLHIFQWRDRSSRHGHCAPGPCYPFRRRDIPER